jgi:hypothetical protein
MVLRTHPTTEAGRKSCRVAWKNMKPELSKAGELSATENRKDYGD